MKAESTVRPNSPFEIEQNADMATIIFYQNIEEKQEEDQIKYTYDEYRIDIPYRPNLEEMNMDKIIKAQNKIFEYTDKEIRELIQENIELKKKLGMKIAE